MDEGEHKPVSKGRKALYYSAMILALAFFGITFFNASWMAPTPLGKVKLLAHRGVYQNYDHAGVDDETCTASRIEQPFHRFIENTVPSFMEARALGAAMVELDIAPTKDGKLVVFHDWTADCRTDGKGDIRDLTLEQVKALDAGYGYTADGGMTFPFRGRGVGMIPTLEEYLRAAGQKPLLFNFKSKDPAEAEMLAAAIKAAGRDSQELGDGFYGSVEDGPVARIRELFPKAWAFSKESAAACSRAYALQGWFGIVPEECREGTLIVPLNRQWLMPGWPNRTIARMDEVGARIIVTGPQGDGMPMGVDLPEQLGEVPSTFNGYLWVEDMATISPALFPSADRRPASEKIAAQEALDRRRAAR